MGKIAEDELKKNQPIGPTPQAPFEARQGIVDGQVAPIDQYLRYDLESPRCSAPNGDESPTSPAKSTASPDTKEMNGTPTL